MDNNVGDDGYNRGYSYLHGILILKYLLTKILIIYFTWNLAYVIISIKIKRNVIISFTI